MAGRCSRRIVSSSIRSSNNRTSMIRQKQQQNEMKKQPQVIMTSFSRWNMECHHSQDSEWESSESSRFWWNKIIFEIVSSFHLWNLRNNSKAPELPELLFRYFGDAPDFSGAFVQMMVTSEAQLWCHKEIPSAHHWDHSKQLSLCVPGLRGPSNSCR